MSDNIFREKSLKKISSPEDLNEYVKVANPGIWVLLISVIILLIGFIAWGYFGRIDSTVNSYAVVSGHKAITYIKEDSIDDMTKESFVMIGDDKYDIISVSELPVQVTNEQDNAYLHLAGLAPGDWVYTIEFNADISDDVYESKIVTERVKPISLLFE